LNVESPSKTTKQQKPKNNESKIVESRSNETESSDEPSDEASDEINDEASEKSNNELEEVEISEEKPMKRPITEQIVKLKNGKEITILWRSTQSGKGKQF